MTALDSTKAESSERLISVPCVPSNLAASTVDLQGLRIQCKGALTQFDVSFISWGQTEQNHCYDSCSPVVLLKTGKCDVGLSGSKKACHKTTGNSSVTGKKRITVTSKRAWTKVQEPALAEMTS